MRLTTMLLAAAATLLALPAMAQDTAIKIGVLNDRSGTYADLSGEGSVVAARMAAEDFGAAAKGMTVEVISADHQNKPDIASNVARQWIDEEGVDVIADVPTSSAALAVHEIVREKDKVFLVSGAAASDITGEKCSPNTVHWTYDTWALAHGTGKAMVEQGGDTWFFITVDYAFGHALEQNATDFVRAAGGKVLGSARHPLNNADFSSYLLQAQGSKAKVVVMANGGADITNAIKQGKEFGLERSGQRFAALLIQYPEVRALGLKTAQGLLMASSFYWDMSPEARAFSDRFAAAKGMPPTMIQAGTYGATLHYLKAVKAAGTDEAKAVMAKMKEMPINDFMTRNGRIREDGRVIRDMYLMQAKTPEESKSPWDLVKMVATVPGSEAFRPLNEGDCPLAAK